MADRTVLPMFPLGTVLVPSMALPLQVFEPRYLRMIEHCLETTREFGVVLISRGSEVGGGEVRTEIGTVARLVEVAPGPGGRLAVMAVGVRRMRVDHWLDDDPYPRAEASDWPDEPTSGPGPGPGLGLSVAGASADDLMVRAEALLRRSAVASRTLGEPAVPDDVEIDPDPAIGSFQILAVSPLGPLDRQAVLAAPGLHDRLKRLGTLLEESVALLEARVRM